MDRTTAKSAKKRLLSEPKIDHREAQPYLGIRTQVPMRGMKKAIPQAFDEVFTWMEKAGVRSAGAPFVRYHVINMEGLMDIEMGVPVAQPAAGDERVQAGTLPAGDYASLVYTGVRNGIKANGALLDWIRLRGLRMDRHDVPAGDAFAARYELQLTNPKDEPRQDYWETEVAIRLAGDQSNSQD